MPQRVVFDTNVVISGLLWRGKAYQCLLLARSGVVRAVYCPEMLAELAEKLHYKFGFSEDRIRAVLHDMKGFSERTEISGTLQVVAADPDDNKFLECALAGKAGIIVSGDRHLLNLIRYQDITILNPAAFIAWIVRLPAIEEESQPSEGDV